MDGPGALALKPISIIFSATRGPSPRPSARLLVALLPLERRPRWLCSF